MQTQNKFVSFIQMICDFNTNVNENLFTFLPFLLAILEPKGLTNKDIQQLHKPNKDVQQLHKLPMNQVHPTTLENSSLECYGP